MSGARYIHVRSGQVVRTITIRDDWLFIDVDRDNQIIGVEVLGSWTDEEVLIELMRWAKP